jgi:hypothetical protein
MYLRIVVSLIDHPFLDLPKAIVVSRVSYLWSATMNITSTFVGLVFFLLCVLTAASAIRRFSQPPTNSGTVKGGTPDTSVASGEKTMDSDEVSSIGKVSSIGIAAGRKGESDLSIQRPSFRRSRFKYVTGCVMFLLGVPVVYVLAHVTFIVGALLGPSDASGWCMRYTCGIGATNSTATDLIFYITLTAGIHIGGPATVAYIVLYGVNTLRLVILGRRSSGPITTRNVVVGSLIVLGCTLLLAAMAGLVLDFLPPLRPLYG